MSREELFVQFNRNPPATQVAIERCQAKLNFPIPQGYLQFLREADGGEGFLGKSYLMLWRVDDLIEMNSAYHVAEFVPGLFLFGSDGGDEAFGFDTRSTTIPIVSVPFVGMDIQSCKEMAPDFNAFLEVLFRGE